jgi:gas vesicle protein
MSERLKRDVLVAFAIGGAIGIAAGIVLAPAAGTETRRRLRELGQKARDGSRTAVATGLRAASDQARRLGRAFEEGRDTFVREASAARIQETLKGGIEADEGRA